MTQPLSPAHPPSPDDGADPGERAEHRWGAVAVVVVTLLVVVAAFAGLHQAAMPQSRVETVDPRTLHLAGEFIESNLGSALEPDGSVRHAVGSALMTGPGETDPTRIPCLKTWRRTVCTKQLIAHLDDA